MWARAVRSCRASVNWISWSQGIAFRDSEAVMLRVDRVNFRQHLRHQAHIKYSNYLSVLSLPIMACISTKRLAGNSRYACATST